MTEPQNLTAITPQAAEQFTAEAQQIVPQVVFKKKSWRHRLQELGLKKQLRSLIAKQRPLFVIEPLAENDTVWYVHTTYNDKGYVTKQEVRLKRCAICWEPATHVERCVEDSTYHRWLCKDHLDK